MSRGRAARLTIRRHLSGVLSTQSKKFPGYPYGSALPHMVDAQGRPIILISHLAEHTHNIEADARVGFLVAQSGSQLQSQGRVSILGSASAVDDAGTQARYLRYHPEGARSLEIGGFRFFRIEPNHVRVIEGFGAIHWLAGTAYVAAPTTLDDAEEDVLQHMNEDHLEALRGYCLHVHQVKAGEVAMIGIDQDGFDVRADGNVLRFEFPEPVTTPGQARQALVALAQQAKN